MNDPIRFPIERARIPAFRPKLVGRDELEDMSAPEILRSSAIGLLGIAMEGLKVATDDIEMTSAIVAQMMVEKAAKWRAEELERAES